MGRRRGRTARCIRCRLLVPECICAALPVLATKTRVHLVLHQAELAKTTSTGILARAMLSNLETSIRGAREGGPIPALSFGASPFYLFPADDAEVLTPAWAAARAQPITLVVPDATWSQARKFQKREAALAVLPCLALPDGARTELMIRKPHPDAAHLSTLEALARALGILEGPEVEAAMMEGFRRFVGRTMFTRGQAPRPP